MTKVAIVRGKYLNNFEMQNYKIEDEKISITGISSQRSIHNQFPFPVITLSSLADLQDIPLFNTPIKVLANRTMGDSQILYGLESYADKFDIFHTADPHYYYSYQLAKLRAENKIKKLIVTSWETIPFNNESVSKKKYIKYFVLEHADKFICYTEKAKECLIQEGVDNAKIEVIRLGVDLDKFQNEKSKTKNRKFISLKKNTNILFVGRLVEEKGVFDLLEAIKQLSISDYKLQIIGDGPLKQDVIDWIGKNNLEKRICINQRRYEDMPELYRQADIFILPSKHTKTWEEQYGMVLVEAMASGLPIISYDSGAIREVIGDVGLLIKEKDSNQLAQTLQDLMADLQKRKYLIRIARERAEKMYDSRKTAQLLADLYKELS